MKSKFGLLALVSCAVLAGCTPQGREEYSAAGHEAAQALKTDVKVTEKAATAATTAAKNTVDKEAKEHPAKK